MVNYNEDDSDEDFERGLNFEQGSEPEQEEDPLETVDTIRRRFSVDSQVNEAVNLLEQTLHAEVDNNAEPTDHFSPVRVTFPVNAPPLRPPPEVIMTNYDEENGEDGANAMQNAVQYLKGYAWNQDNLKFYFGQVEIKMKCAGVKKSFTKLQVLSTILPHQVILEVEHILSKQETEFAENDAYLQLKREILRIFGPSNNAAFERAMSRVLTGKPSQLARSYINDMCTHKLVNCCCNAWIYGLWLRQLPSNVRQGISHLEFTAETYNQITDLADKIYASTRPSQQVAAVSPPDTENINTGFHQMWPNEATQEVAALNWRGSGRGRGGFRGQGRGGQRGQGRGNQRGGNGQNRGQNRGGGSAGGGNNKNRGPYSASNPRHQGTRHPDLPPFESCKKHWDWGKSAHFCLEPGTCPWSQFYTPRGQQ